MKPKIFITGDSWGVHEWPAPVPLKVPGEESIFHGGLETYFKEVGMEVHNLSSAGSSNKSSIERLFNYVDSDKTLYNNTTDSVIWIMGDPIRDLRPYNTPEKKLSKELTINKGYNNLIKKLFHDRCFIANKLAEEHSMKIIIAGGIASFNTNELKPYKNLVPLVPSWYDLLLSNVEKKMIPDISIWTSQPSDVHIRDIDLEYIKQEGGDNLAKQIVNELWEINEFDRIVHNSNRFFELDKNHPDRHAHKILFNVIWENLKNP